MIIFNFQNLFKMFIGHLSSFSVINMQTLLFKNILSLNVFVKIYIMSQTKREQVISHIRYLRQELREMHLGIKEDDLFPEPGELRGLMAQLEALLELIEGNTKIQSNSEAA